MTGYNLKRMFEELKEILGPVWVVKYYTAKECKMTQAVDPPCAYIEATCRFDSFTIDIDGDVINGNGDEATTLPREGGHKERMKALIKWLRG